MFNENEHPRDNDGKFTNKNDGEPFRKTVRRVDNYENNSGTIWFDKDLGNTTSKKTQLNIVNATNPAPDTYHTWIRSESDIKTANEVYQQALQDNDGNEAARLTDDFGLKDWSRAMQKGNITIYSSYPIKNGVFVSPSKQEAMQYSGNGKVYSMDVPLSEVAWIDELQGQYAKANGHDEFQPSKAKSFATEKSKTHTKSITKPIVNEIRGNKYYRGDSEYDVFNELPNGWKIETVSLTAPEGYQWADNGQSLFSGNRKRALVKK